MGIVALVVAIAYSVFAWGPGWGKGPPMIGNWGRGPGYPWQHGGGYGNLTQEQRTQLDNLYQKLFDETATLRNEIWTKSGELNSLLNTSNPDSEKAKALQKELNDLGAKIAEKRLDLDLAARKIVPEGGFAPGWGMGPGMVGPGIGRGYGPGPWGN